MNTMSLKSGVGAALRDLHEAHAREAWATKQRARERAVELLARALAWGPYGVCPEGHMWQRAEFGGVILHARSAEDAGSQLEKLAFASGLPSIPYEGPCEGVGIDAWCLSVAYRRRAWRWEEEWEEEEELD